MPVLRFVRDKKGFENIYIVHTAREGGRARSRLLYWFRTPPGVKVGRSALDEAAIRRLEEQHPDLEFDWPRMLKLRDSLAAPSQATHRRPLDRRRKGSEAASRPSRSAGGAGRSAAHRPSAVAEIRDDLPPEPEVEATDERAEDEAPAPTPPAADLDESAIADASDDVESPAAAGSELARLIGDEGVERVRASYAEILARISRKESDPARQQAVRDGVAELDPDVWMNGPDVAAALERFEQEIRRLRMRLGRRRGGRRRGRGRRGAPGDAGSGSTGNTTAEGSGNGGPETDPPGADD